MVCNSRPVVALEAPYRNTLDPTRTPSGELLKGKMIAQPPHSQWLDSSNVSVKSQALIYKQQQDMMVEACFALTRCGDDKESRDSNAAFKTVAETRSSAAQPDGSTSELLSLINIPPTDPLLDISDTDLVGTVSDSGIIKSMIPTVALPVITVPSATVQSDPVMTTSESKTLNPENADVLSEFGHSFTRSESSSAARSYSLVDESEYMQQTPVAPPQPPSYCSDLHPDVPAVEVKTAFDGHSSFLKHYCWDPKHPIVLIRNLGEAVGIDLTLFSSQSLSSANGQHRMDLRIQRKQESDENWDLAGKRKVWKFESTGSETTIGEYARYQEWYQKTATSSSSSQNSGTVSAKQFQSETCLIGQLDDSQSDVIKFGTNADLSEATKWGLQLAELQKLPEFTKVSSELNMLSFVDYTILGVNSVQLYMKVPGCRTPGHQENNNFCSVNFNVGPEDTEWFAVPNRYWGVLNTFCERNKIDFLSGSWWPVLDDLEKEGIPVYRFLQKRGDLVWVNPGTPHWVQAVGICNNVSWNVGPMTGHQYRMAMERYEWNKMRRVKSIVPMIHLSWNVARGSVQIADTILYGQLRECLTRSLLFCEYQVKRLKDAGILIKWHGRTHGEPAYYCTVCEAEVFNLLFVSSQNSKGEYYVLCEQCTRATDPQVREHTVLYQFSIEELKAILKSFVSSSL